MSPQHLEKKRALVHICLLLLSGVVPHHFLSDRLFWTVYLTLHHFKALTYFLDLTVLEKMPSLEALPRAAAQPGAVPSCPALLPRTACRLSIKRAPLVKVFSVP